MRFPNVQLMMDELKTYRREKGDTDLAAFLEKKYQATPEQLYHDLNIPLDATFEMLYTINEHSKYIAPEVIRDAIILGMRSQRFLELVIAVSGKVDTDSVKRPYVDFSGMKDVKKRTPGATIQTDTVNWRSKYVRTKELGKGIKFPMGFNFIKGLRLNILPKYFEAVGMKILKQNQDLIINTILDGESALDDNDQPVDESAFVIGVLNQANGITEDDYINACVIMAMAGRTVDTMFSGKILSQSALKWETFKAEKFTSVEQKMNIHIPLPTSLNLFPILGFPEDKMALSCTPIGIEELKYEPLTVLADLIVAKKIEEAYATINVGYSTIQRNHKIVIDKTQTFDESQIPDWLYY